MPIITTAHLDATYPYPQPDFVSCEVVAIDTELLWHVETTTVEMRFVVRPEQLIEFDWG